MMIDENGKELLEELSALANPHRLRIVAALGSGRNYVSQLARDLEISRPLLHLHLQKLEAAGLVRSSLELSDDGKAMRFFELEPFAITVTPESITRFVIDHPELGKRSSKEESCMSWPEAAVAIAGIVLVIVIVSVIAWQIFRTGQVAISSDATSKRDANFAQAIADATAAQNTTSHRLAELSEEIKDLRGRIGSMEKLLQEV